MATCKAEQPLRHGVTKTEGDESWVERAQRKTVSIDSILKAI